MKLSLARLMRMLPNEEAAYDLMESIMWPKGPVCPHCDSVNHAYHIKPKTGRPARVRVNKDGKVSVSYRKLWKCAECRKPFSVTVGTVMERSKIPLSKWFIGFYLYSSAKNGISSHELSRQLEISQEAAWFMTHRIRYAVEQLDTLPLGGIVESDETWIGGKIHGKGLGIGAYSQNKTPVVTLVQRGGEARSRALTKVDGENLAVALRDNVKPEAILMTDTQMGYAKPGREYAAHLTVNHNQDEYVRGKGPSAAHVNTAEGFFSQLKRSVDGTHHHISQQHLHRYLSEFDERYNTRTMTDGDRTLKAIKQTVGKRLMYEKVVSRDSQA